MLKNLTDEELAARVQEGVTPAFGILFDRYEEKILRYGRRFLSNYHDIEDAVQEIFMKAYQHMQSFNVTRKFSTWLYRIAHNTFINVIKKKGREPVSFFEFDVLVQLPHKGAPSVEEEFASRVAHKEMQAHIASLPAKYREPLVLYYFEEKNYEEIADIMHIPVSTVGVRLKRGREHLKKIV